MKIEEYITKTEIHHVENKSLKNFWTIGLDYGFSGVKGIAPNKVFCVPNCVLQVSENFLQLEASDKDIVLKDENGWWIIGERADEIMPPANAINYETEMYERNRYFTPTFQALMKVGLGVALISNHFRKYDGESIVIQTGLPPEYKATDSSMLKEALAGDYKFELKIGKRSFQKFSFTIDENNVYIMDQPMGSLFSTITDNRGIQTPDGLQILKSNTLVCDPGFKTLDIFDISSGTIIRKPETFDTLGMHEVFRRTIEDAKKKYPGINMNVLGMQKALRKGYFTAFVRKEMRNVRVSFEDILVRNTEIVCKEAINKILSLYNYLQDHEYLILTGGTGNAWLPIFLDFFKHMETLSIISANRNNTTLSNVYSNVRGYYFYLIGMLERRR